MNLEHKIITENEKRDLIIRAKNDNHAFQIISDMYVDKYYKYILKKYYIKNNLADEDDIAQVMRIAIWEVIKTYNPDLVKFNYNVDVYFFKRIEYKVIDLLAYVNRQKHKILNDAVNYYQTENKQYGEKQISIFNLLKSDVDIEKSFIILEQIKMLKKSLSELELKILSLRLQGFRYEEISKKLDKNTKCIDNSIQRIRKKARAQV